MNGSQQPAATTQEQDLQLQEDEPQQQEQEQEQEQYRPQYAAIDRVKQLASQAEQKMAFLPDKRQRLMAAVALKIWRQNAKLAAATANDVRQLASRSKQLAYEAGCLSEELLRQLFCLDNVHGDDNVRQTRKATVLHIKNLMKQADDVRASLAAVDKLLVKLRATEEKTKQAELPVGMEDEEVEASPAEEEQEREKAKDSDAEEDDEEEEDSDEEEEEEHQQEKDDDAKQAQEPLTIAKVLADRALSKSQLPRFRVRTQQRRLQDGIAVLFPLEGLHRPSLQIRHDKKKRQLTISGVVLPFAPIPAATPLKQLLAVAARMQLRGQWGWFEETLTVPEQLALEEATSEMARDDLLIIRLPEAPQTPFYFGRPRSAHLRSRPASGFGGFGGFGGFPSSSLFAF